MAYWSRAEQFKACYSGGRGPIFGELQGGSRHCCFHTSPGRKKRREKKRARNTTTDKTVWKHFISTPVLHFKKASQSQFVPNQQSRTRRGKLPVFSPDLKVGETETWRWADWYMWCSYYRLDFLKLKKKKRADEFVGISKTGGFNRKQGSKTSESFWAGLSVGQTNRLLSWIRRRSDSQCLIAGCFQILNNVNSVTKALKVRGFCFSFLRGWDWGVRLSFGHRLVQFRPDKH